MWIHEGWATYLECLYVEYRWGREDVLKYMNAYKSKVKNEKPIIAERGVNAAPNTGVRLRKTCLTWGRTSTTSTSARCSGELQKRGVC